MPFRTATLVLQAGLLAVVVAALPYKLFELDRYFVPKELVLHVSALLLAVGLLARTRWRPGNLVDALLALFLGWSVVSALFAPNYWLAQRAVSLSLSSAVIFWAARSIGADASRPVLLAAAFAAVLAAATCMAQAYGVVTDYFSLNRAPGGTFGNRNFAAHFAAIGLPALIYCTVTARRSGGAVLGSIGTAIVVAALVLSRSRAAWLAVAASMTVLTFAFLASRGYWKRQSPVAARFKRLAVAATAGAALAILLPNRLNWSSDSPYLDSARGMVDFRTGSGLGRVAQYVNSLRMAATNPLLGVGPGNWPVRYPRFAPSNDRSLTDDGMAANPWPSSDWVAFVSERGLVAAGALLGVFALLFLGACRHWREQDDVDGVLAKMVLLGTIAATLVVGSFDAALLLAAPAFLAWAILGAASGATQSVRSRRDASRSRGASRTATVVALLVLAVSVVRSATQVGAIITVGNGGTRAGWIAGSAWDPGSYRINLKVAELYASRGRCGPSRRYARRALGLFPYAAAPRRVLLSCP